MVRISQLAEVETAGAMERRLIGWSPTRAFYDGVAWLVLAVAGVSLTGYRGSSREFESSTPAEQFESA